MKIQKDTKILKYSKDCRMYILLIKIQNILIGPFEGKQLKHYFSRVHLAIFYQFKNSRWTNLLTDVGVLLQNV